MEYKLDRHLSRLICFSIRPSESFVSLPRPKVLNSSPNASIIPSTSSSTAHLFTPLECRYCFLLVKRKGNYFESVFAWWNYLRFRYALYEKHTRLLPPSSPRPSPSLISSSPSPFSHLVQPFSSIYSKNSEKEKSKLSRESFCHSPGVFSLFVNFAQPQLTSLVGASCNFLINYFFNFLSLFCTYSYVVRTRRLNAYRISLLWFESEADSFSVKDQCNTLVHITNNLCLPAIKFQGEIT